EWRRWPRARGCHRRHQTELSAARLLCPPVPPPSPNGEFSGPPPGLRGAPGLARRGLRPVSWNLEASRERLLSWRGPVMASAADRWIADRMHTIPGSSIRRFFEMGRSLPDPIDLSIGQPDFAVPTPVQDAACAAIRAGHNGYTPTSGLPELRQKLLADVRR